MSNDEVIRLTLETQGQKGLVDLAEKADQAAKQLDKASVASEKLTRASGGSGQSMLQLGRVIQDFTQGGLGGILNNLEGMATALGLGAGIAGAATVAGVAFFVAKPYIVAFFDSLGEGSDKAKPLKDRLEEVGKALETLANKMKLSNGETSEYIKLAKEQGKLDKETAENKAKLAAMAAQPKGPKPDKSIGEKVTDVAAGNQDYIASYAGLGLLNQIQGRKRAIFDKGAGATAADRDELKRLDAESLGLRGHEKDAGSELLTKAMGGDVEAARKLISVLPAGEIRDDLVRATTSDRTKDEARFSGRQFLDNTLGKAGRALGNRAAQSRADKKDAEESRKLEQEGAAGEAAFDATRGTKAKRSLDQHVRESQRLGRTVGKAFDKQNNARPDIQPRIPMLQKIDFATGQAMSSVQDTQAAMMREQARQAASLRAIQQRAKNMTQVTLRRGNR